MSALPQPVESRTTGYQETPSMVLPAAPPQELDPALDSAAQRAAALSAIDRELHFVTDASGDLRVEIRDTRGNVLKLVSPSQAMAIMGGLGSI